jgi:hypothetical protein
MMALCMAIFICRVRDGNANDVRNGGWIGTTIGLYEVEWSGVK